MRAALPIPQCGCPPETGCTDTNCCCTPYVLPIARAAILGGIMVGDGLGITVDGHLYTTQAGGGDVKVLSVANVAALKAVVTGELENYALIQTAGYNYPGDGGGALFYWSVLSTTATNLGTVFQADDSATGRFIWVGGDSMSVMMFGADLSGATDSYAAINAALTLTSDVSWPLIVTFPHGTFKFGTGLVVPQGASLVGSGFNYTGTNGTKLIYSGTNSKAIRYSASGSTVGEFWLTSSTYQTSSQTSSSGMFFDSGSFLNTLKNVRINGFANGVNGSSTSWQNCLQGRIWVDGFSITALNIPAGTTWTSENIYVQNLIGPSNQTTNITAASYVTTALTVTVDALPDYLQVGMYAIVAGLAPSAFNGTFFVTDITGLVVTLLMVTDPGTPLTTTIGTLRQPDQLAVGPAVVLGQGDFSNQSLDVEHCIFSGSTAIQLGGVATSIGVIHLETIYSQNANFTPIIQGTGGCDVGVVEFINSGFKANQTACVAKCTTVGRLRIGAIVSRDIYKAATGVSYIGTRANGGVEQPVVGKWYAGTNFHGGSNTPTTYGAVTPLVVDIDTPSVSFATATGLTIDSALNTTGVVTNTNNIVNNFGTHSESWQRAGVGTMAFSILGGFNTFDGTLSNGTLFSGFQEFLVASNRTTATAKVGGFFGYSYNNRRWPAIVANSSNGTNAVYIGGGVNPYDSCQVGYLFAAPTFDVASSGVQVFTWTSVGCTFSQPVSLGTTYLSQTKVAGSTGTTAGLLCKLDSAGQFVTVATSATDAIGVAISTKTVGQNVEVATRGTVSVVADNTTVIGNLAICGTSTAGRVRDAGTADITTIAVGTQVLGRFLSVATVGNTASLQLFGPGQYGASAGTGTVTTVSVVTANGLSGSVANATTTPAITLSVGAINLATATGLPLTTGVTGILPSANGGTGINNGSFTITLAGSLVTTGAFTTTFTAQASATFTLPPATCAIGYLNIPQNSQSANYTTVLADSGKHLYHPSADTSARTWTIDSNANVAYAIGTAITFVNDTSGGVITIAITSDTLVLAGAGTTGSRSLAANGVATAIKITSTRWIISGTGLT